MSSAATSSLPAPSMGRLAAACAYLVFLIALPPDVGPTSYALLVVGATALYLFPELGGGIRRLVYLEYAIFGALVIGYLAASYVGGWQPGGRLFDAGAILPQAAGVLLMLVCIPAISKATAALFADRSRIWVTLAIIAVSVFAALVWREDESIIGDGQLYGVLAPALFIQFALFALVVTLLRQPAARAIALLFPLLFVGAASNFVIQLSLIVLAATAGHRWVMRGLAIALPLGLLLAINGEAWLDPLLADDTNSLVRLHLWRAALPDVLAHPLGIGFGPAFTEMTAIRDPFVLHVYGQDPRNALSVANHSSLLDLALRTGWLGLIAFIVLLRRSLEDARSSDQYLLAAGAIAIVLVAGTMNPMLESARSALFVAFAIGLARGIAAPFPVSSPVRGQGDAVPTITPTERRKALAARAS